MGEFSISHWLIILVIVLIFVGPSKLPGLGKGLGEAIRGFKKGLNDDPPGAQGSDPNRQIHSGNGSANANQTHVKNSEKTES